MVLINDYNLDLNRS